jgi:CheY-like chemotaxis protein
MTGKPSVDDCLKVLGLARGATPDDYRQAYKDLVEVWHPDRLAHNERLQLLATDRLKEINEAYAYLMEHAKCSRPSITLSRDGARPRVLCVDDEVLVLKGLKRQLSLRFDVETASDAQSGLDVLLGDEEVAVVLSDLMMPGIDGIAFLRQAMIVSPHTTRILLTGYREAVGMAVAVDQRFLFKILDKNCGDDLLFDTVQQGVDVWRARNEYATSGH